MSKLYWGLSLLFVFGCDIADVIHFTGGDPSPTLDLECYDSCLKKGLESAECEGYCDTAENDSEKASAKGDDAWWEKDEDGRSRTDGNGSRNRDPNDQDPGDEWGEKEEARREKACATCWYEHAECAAEARACEESLACTQLQWCPFICDRPNCVDECNAIIPTGVALLTALAECAVCNQGPCAQACQGSILLAYCD